MTSVLIVSTSPALRAGFRALLYEEGMTPVDAIATFGDGITTPAADVWLLADDALELISQPLPLSEGAQSIVLLSDDVQALTRLRALPLRGWAWLAADAGGAEIKAAVEAAAQGLVVLPLAFSRQLLSQSRLSSTDEDPVEPLTPREIEVLTLLGQGLPNKLIARQLVISEHTVKFHISSIFAKLGAASRTDAVSRGARAGLIML